MRLRHPANIARYTNRTPADRAIDGTVGFMGSLRFIGWQTALITVWIALNTAHGWSHWDEYPFVLLNLVFSTQAAYATPLIMLAQNRQAEHDRQTAEHAYSVGERAADRGERTGQLVERIATHLGVDQGDHNAPLP